VTIVGRVGSWVSIVTCFDSVDVHAVLVSGKQMAKYLSTVIMTRT
jgi:hypothetical protein